MATRRDFLMASGIVVLASSFGRADDRSPSQLDHVILGCKDLDAGIDFVEERTGIRAARGGVHPDRGTANALLSLGERHYLEIMAPDPNAKSVQTWAARQLETLKGLARPRLIGWAVHTNDMQMVAKRLRDSGLQIVGPYPGSRARPDGKVLHWQSFSLADDLRGLLPFFIEWGKDSVHPSSDAPGGCRIERFALTGPDTAELSKALRRIEVEASVEQNPVAQLHIRIAGPKGDLEATS